MSDKLKQPQGLISVLLDRNAEYGDRDDAALDLAQFDEAEASKALFDIAISKDTDPDLADTCGESLAEIWCRNKKIDIEIFTALEGIAKTIAIGTLEARCPDLLVKGT